MLAESFPMLIARLRAEHHAQRGLAEMAERTRVPYQTLWRWENGALHMPEYHVVARLADAYGLDVEDVMALAHRDHIRVQRGKPVPIAKIERKRGPNPHSNSARSRRSAARASMRVGVGTQDAIGRAPTGRIMSRSARREQKRWCRQRFALQCAA